MLRKLAGLPGYDGGSFRSFSAEPGSLNDETTDLAQIYDRLRPSLTAVRKAANERLGAVRAELEKVRGYVFWSIWITVTVVIAAALWFGRCMAAPLIRMVAAMQHLAQGDLERDREGRRRDEIGKISEALSIFRDKLRETWKLAADQEEAKREAEVERRQAMLETADGFERTVGQIVERVSSASSEIEIAAEGLSRTAEVTHSPWADVAAASEQSSASVQSAAAASEERPLPKRWCPR